MTTALLVVIAVLLLVLLVAVDQLYRAFNEALALKAMSARDDALRLRELVAGILELQQRADKRSNETAKQRWERTQGE